MKLEEIKERMKKPTPNKCRRVGKALVATGTAATGLLIYTDHEYWATFAVVATIIGTFLTTLCTSDG